MKEKPYDLGYYNPIYREVLELLPNNTDVVIFDKFWHEYVARVRGNRSLYFQLSARDIERRTEIGHNHASKHIKRMVEIGILLQDGKNFSVAGDYVLSLLNTYRSIDDCDREDFRAAVNTHDIDALEGFGFVQYDGITSELKYLSAKTEGGLNLTQAGENSPERVKNNPSGLKLTQLDSIAPTIINNYRARVRENYTVTQIVEAICGISGLNLTQVDIISPAAEIFSDAETISRDAEFILFILATQISPEGGLNLIHPVGQNSPTSGLKLTHRNIIEDNNDENKGMPKASYIEGENDLKEEIDENLPGEEFKRVDMAGYSQVKHKNSLPYYSTSQVREITANPEEAVTASDKLFIYLMWEILSDQTYKVEDGEESDDKVEGSQFPVEGFKSTILRTAYGSMCDAIEDGMFETKSGQEFPVDKNLEPITWEQALLIPGFETISTEQEDYYIITSAKIHNIFGEPVEPVKGKQHRRRSEEERERENEYFHQLILCRNDDDKYPELTNAEAAVIIFMDEHFQVDYEKGEVTGLKKEFMKIDGNYVNSMELARYINIVQGEVDRAFTLADFLSLLTNGKPGLDGSLNISERMFSYDNIQFWNQKHGEISPIKL